jgi:hypothetical protein
MPKYFVNAPMKSVRRNGKAVSKKVWAASGFRRNPTRKRAAGKPSAKQLAARKKFAAMSRARAASGKKATRATTGEGTMARRKKRAARRRTSVASRRRRTSVRRYASNAPTTKRRKRRRVGVTARRGKRSTKRRYRRNPPLGGLMRDGKDLLIGTGFALGGMAVGRFVASNVPLNVNNAQLQPYVDFGKGVAVAVAIQMFGSKAIGRDNARLAAIGALVVPVKNLVISFMPQAANFLGAYDRPTAMPGFTSTGRMNAYPPRAQVSAYPSAGMGSYASHESYAGAM